MKGTAKNNDRKKYVLQVQRGKELSLQRLDDICNKESIMRPSYEMAMRALMRIMRRTKQFHKDHENKIEGLDVFALENQLFGYSGNIIAFAAPRGGGKTATMLSFSKVLNEGFGKADCSVDNSFLNDMRCVKGESPESWMARCCFVPMTPIAPAVLEGEQNILYVVLSRLYRYAERLIAERSRYDRIQEIQKNQIIRSFQKALSGINGIKHPDKMRPGDLASMQDVSDGLSLSRHFYDLVQNILKLAAGDRDVSDRYLVIQLDDADSKMEKVYEVMEDVRKYLMIPNLVILISVDQKCMSDVVFQDNLKCFPDLLRIDEVRLSRDLSQITNKYIDKLIPPTHMVQLPQIDQVVIHWGDMLRLRYVDEDGKDVYDWMTEEEMDLQTAILMLIYRKTDILFIKPSHYLHNIIPRTLRGFVQLLSLLDSMENIPDLDFGKYHDVKSYAEAVLKQAEIVAINQRKFADYFRNSWINVKITDLQDLEFLRKFADTVSANRIRLAVKHLCKNYGDGFKENKPQYFIDKQIEIKDIREREDLDQLLWEIDQLHRTETDFRLRFALRTLFTLDSHQHILKRKRETARDYLKREVAESEDTTPKGVEGLGFLLFDLSPDDMWIPKNLWVDEVVDKVVNEHGLCVKYAKQYERLLTPLLMLGKSGYDSTVASMKKRLLNDGYNDREIQWILHQTQEFAVMLYANSDVSYAVRKYLMEDVECPDEENKDIFIEHTIIKSIVKQVNGFNDGYLKWYSEKIGERIEKLSEDNWTNSFEYELAEINKKRNPNSAESAKSTNASEGTIISPTKSKESPEKTKAADDAPSDDSDLN